MNKQCSVAGCELAYNSGGYCVNHLYKWKRYGDPLHPDQRGYHARKHGLSTTKIYRVWQSMVARCTHPQHKSYKDYGGRGITVCDRWLTSVTAFVEDVGDRPVGMTLERKDVNGNYEPGNVRWATPAEQMHNRRDNVLSWDKVRYIRQYCGNGESHAYVAWKLGVNLSLVARVVSNQIWKEPTNAPLP